MCLFTAIDIPRDIKDRLSVLVAALRPLAHIKWSPIENLHLTTKFIGDWPETQLGQMKLALADIVAPDPIEIAIRGLGWFPNARDPRVFWAGLSAGAHLKSLAEATAGAVRRIGVPGEDRDYSPHLTLARIRERIPLDALRNAVAKLHSDDFGSFRAQAFFLYLSAAGKYTKLAEFPL